MAQLAAIVYSRQVLHDLRNNPLNTLNNYTVVAGGVAGIDTVRMRMAFAAAGNNIRIGSPAHCANVGQGAGLIGTRHGGMIYVNGLFTPMRFRQTATRTNPTARFGVTNDSVWLTTLQTGCSLAIFDWGGNQYSMVHLQPYADAEFSSVTRTLISPSRSWIGREYKRTWLKSETGSVVRASLGGGANPLRYIMVQSSHLNAGGTYVQVIGIVNGAGWDFYMQKRTGGEFAPTNLVAQQLAWTNWGAYPWWSSY